MDVCRAAQILEVPILAIGQIIFDGKLQPTSTEDDIRTLKEKEPEYVNSLKDKTNIKDHTNGNT